MATSWEIQARARRQRQELADRQRVTVRCAHCPQHGAGRGFKFTGPVGEARVRFAEHRAKAHPELVSLDQAKLEQAKKRRIRTSKEQAIRANGYMQRREFLTPDELQQREILRREARSDLPPLDTANEAA